ncbi:MCE family protein [candidate division KSB1 bacterium]|nr:MCE family protein [candidate division KSB1 bacterium]RQW01294.1 MAG: MCE family protein [candidate division KSB1 bacterium]
MDYKASEIKAGIFITTSVLLFVVFLAIIVGMNSFSEKEIYLTRFRYVGGIEKGSAVRYAGLQVGSVIDVRLADDGYPGAEVVLQVEKNTPIRTNSRAFMTTIGIMGSTYIEITSGTPEASLLESGALIPSEEVTGFAQMSGVASTAIDELTALLHGMNDLLNENNKKRISEMIASLNQIAQVTEKNLQVTLENMNSVIAEVNTLTLAAKEIVVSNDASLTNSIHHLEKLLSQSITTLNSLDIVLSEVDRSLFENQQQYNQIMTNLNSMTENLNDFSQTIKERPWNVVRKTYPPQRELE